MKIIDSEEDAAAITKGVADGFDFWLSQHEVSFPHLLENTIGETFRDWLDDNTETIIEKILGKTISVELGRAARKEKTITVRRRSFGNWTAVHPG